MTPEEIVNAIRLFLEIIGAITVMFAILGGFLTFIGWTAGIFTVMKRLGLGRWYRKVLVVGKASETKALKKDLVDSGVFWEKNVDEADNRSLADVKDASLILLDYWSLGESEVSAVLANKHKSAGLVVYSPMGRRIPESIGERINNEPFTTLANMRGRLVNDLLVTLMSTGYDKK